MVFEIQKTGLKWKKKKWIDILAPKSFGEKKVGETLIDNVDNMLGGSVVVSVAQLTNNIKKQNLLITLKLTKFEADKAKTEVKEFKLEKSYASRLVRKGTSKVSDSFTVETKDNKKVRIKSVIVTKGKVSSTIARAIHYKQRELVKEYVKSQTFDNLVNELVNFKVQNGLKQDFNKVHPVKTFQVLFAGLEK